MVKIKEAIQMNYGKKGASDKQKAMTSKTTMVGKKVGVTFFKAFILCLIVIGVIVAGVGIGAIKSVIDSAPDISDVDISPSGFSTTIYDQNGNETTKLVTSGSNRIYVTLDKIPENLQDAFVAIEDERFWEHNGIDMKGIVRVIVKGITEVDFSEGASTITQQLLKNNVFTGWTEESSFAEKAKRKIQEQYLAVQLEKTTSKETILENYLNTINLGQNTLGVQAASKRYFNKEVSELTLSESAVIAAITKNPTKYNPVSYPEENLVRREKVLKDMLSQGYITSEEYDEALADDVYARIQNVNEETKNTSIYSYFVDELTEQVKSDLMTQKGYTETQAEYALYSGGLSIYTTQDPGMQQICDEEFSNEDNYPDSTEVELDYRLSVEHADGTTKNYDQNTLKNYFKEVNGDEDYNILYANADEAAAQVELYKQGIVKEGDAILGEVFNTTLQPQASIVIIDQTTGYVKAIYGGRGTKEASLTLNRATNTTRQPGSTFKILAGYAPALDTAGMTLATVQYDAPYAYANGKQVKNYDGKFRGYTTIREAIEDSINIVAVKTITQITPQLGYDYLLNFGFSTLSKDEATNQSMVLGGLTHGVTNLELTAAYAAIANGGTYTKPIFYTKIVDHEGNVLIDNTPQTTTVLKESTAFLLTSAMTDVVTKGTGKNVAFGGMPIAGKTGTTSNKYDVWFSGFTPYYTCSVWAGYDTNHTLGAGSFQQTLWKKVMSRIHAELPSKDFSRPDSIVKATICKKSGKLAVEGLCDQDPRGSMVSSEYFAKGTAPTEVCDTHVKVSTCTVSGRLAGDYCPKDLCIDKVYIITPEGITDATGDSPYQVPSSLTDICDIHQAITIEPPVIETPQTPEGNPQTPVTPPDSSGGTGSETTQNNDPTTDSENTSNKSPKQTDTTIKR